MESWAHISLLIVLISLCCSDCSKSVWYADDVDHRKLLASDDVERFLQQARDFGEGFGSNWIVMPNGDGDPNLAVLDNSKLLFPEQLASKEYSFESALNLVNFHYYKNSEPQDTLNFLLTDSKNVPFDSEKPTKMIIHGWMADANSSVITNIKNAYLSEEVVNVIGVNWSEIASDYFYPNAAKATEVVGRIAGKFIDSLIENHNAKYSDIHVIGHSLGAHVAGFAGSFAKEKIGRITGLDPALPGFQYLAGPEGRLDNTDANFVDVIHTCSGVLGISIPVGHVDFYPNGGSVFQPGCGLKVISQACSHSRSHEFFTESIHKSSDFEAVRCKDWDHFKKNECENVFSIMGEHIPPNTKEGVYYLKTNYESPFSQGHGGINY